MVNAIEEQLELGAQDLAIQLSEDQRNAMLAHLTLLSKWNKTYNLTTVSEPEQTVIRHTLDSLSIQPWMDGERVADIGSGGGFPGVPLAICNPQRQFVLLDSRGKKVNFINTVRRELKLKNLTGLHYRVEEYRPEQLFDTLVSRAFSSLAKFFHLTQHLLKSGGRLLAMKGEYPTAELQELNDRYDLSTQCHELQVPYLNATRHLVVISPTGPMS